MKCHCGKLLKEQTIATKTAEQGEHIIVVTSRQALVCAEHGVVVWDPPRPRAVQPNSYPYSQPGLIPAASPYRPSSTPSYPMPNPIWSQLGPASGALS